MKKDKSLTEIIYKYKNNSFEWGEIDCCIFTASIVEEFFNIDLPYWKNVITYSSEKGAMKALKKLGCKDLIDLPEIILNTKRKPISEVKLGEPVYYINEKGRGILGICNGKRAYFLQRGGGLTARNIEECKYCWRVN